MDKQTKQINCHDCYFIYIKYVVGTGVTKKNSKLFQVVPWYRKEKRTYHGKYQPTNIHSVTFPEFIFPIPFFQDCLSSLFDHPVHISRTNVGEYNQKRSVPGFKWYYQVMHTVLRITCKPVIYFKHIFRKFEVMQGWVKNSKLSIFWHWIFWIEIF